jgi:hypothetical protein
MAFAFAFSFSGRQTFNSPSLNSALTLPPSAPLGSVKLLKNLPNDYSPNPACSFVEPAEGLLADGRDQTRAGPELALLPASAHT